MSMAKKILLILRKPDDPSARFRILCYAEQLRENFEVSIFFVESDYKSRIRFFESLTKIFRFYFLILKSKQFSVIFMQRPMSSINKKSFFFERMLSFFNKNIIFDFDDALHIANPTKIKGILKIAKFCIVGNVYLKNFTSLINSQVVTIPTGINTDIYIPSLSNSSDIISIGWTGTFGNYKYFTPELKSAISLILSLKSNVEFIFISDRPPDASFSFPYRFIKWSIETEVSDLHEIDIGLMPLVDDDWSRGKCGFKLIQYGAIGIPSITSPVGVNASIVIDKKTGFLVRNENWFELLSILIDNAYLRNNMGCMARQHIFNNFSTNNLYADLKSVICHVIDSKL